MRAEHPLVILDGALKKVFEKNQSLCLDNEFERNLLRNLVVGTFAKLTKENEEQSNEPNNHH